MLMIAVLLGPAANAAAFYAEQYHFSACMEDVPIRSAPNMGSRQIGTIPRGTVVKADSSRDRWIRVIYKIRQGYLIGWSLTGLLCPLDLGQGFE
jgi:hypothetical protein